MRLAGGVFIWHGSDGAGTAVAGCLSIAGGELSNGIVKLRAVSVSAGISDN
jgi:hypothetical protein